MSDLQYYYRVTGCPAQSSTDPNCICWHDEGAGPLESTDNAPNMSWRKKPLSRTAVAWMDEEGCLHTTFDSASFKNGIVTPLYTSTNSCAETATVITELVSACEQLEKAVLNLLPGAAQIVADVGLINDALCAGVNARGKAKKKGACHE